MNSQHQIRSLSQLIGIVSVESKPCWHRRANEPDTNPYQTRPRNSPTLPCRPSLTCALLIPYVAPTRALPRICWLGWAALGFLPVPVFAPDSARIRSGRDRIKCRTGRSRRPNGEERCRIRDGFLNFFFYFEPVPSTSFSASCAAFWSFLSWRAREGRGLRRWS